VGLMEDFVAETKEYKKGGYRELYCTVQYKRPCLGYEMILSLTLPWWKLSLMGLKPL
jgi:hypothetical protein